MTVATMKNYKVTIILDTRGREESVEQLTEDVKKEITSLGIEVTGEENLGRRDFARQPDPRVGAGNYIQFHIAAPPDAATRLQEHFRLNTVVFRILVQAV